MSATAAFGYEKEDGSIHYVLYHNLQNDEIEQYVEKRTNPYTIRTSILNAMCLDNYFSQESFMAEASTCRVLYRMDGSVVLKNTSAPQTYPSSASSS